MRVNNYKVYLSNFCGDRFQIEIITPFQYTSNEIINILKKENISGMYLAWFDNAKVELCDTEIYSAWNKDDDYVIKT